MTPVGHRRVALTIAFAASADAVCAQTHTFIALTSLSPPGTISRVRFRAPVDVAVDRSGNLYVAESLNHTIRKVTVEGRIVTLAGDPGEVGSIDGIGSDARFNHPSSITVDSAGTLYVADNNTIRKITPAGAVTTLAGSAGQTGLVNGRGSEARFSFRETPASYRYPGLAVDREGNVFVADVGNRRIRRISPDGNVSTVAESFSGFDQLERMAFDPAGNLLVIDIGRGMIHRVSPAGNVTPVDLRDGGTSPPRGLAVDDDGNVYLAYGDVAHWDYYWADYPVGYVAKLTPGGERSILAGNRFSYGGEADGVGPAAEFKYPHGLAIDRTGNLYVADTINYLIRKVTKEGAVTTLASIAPNAAGSSPSSSQIVNISVRATVRPPQPLVISLEASAKPVLLRAVGQGLRPFLPTETLALDPRLDLFPSAVAPVRSNDNWGGTQVLRDAFVAAGAFPLEADSTDGALLHTLEGQSTVQMTASAAGIALFEMYDVAPGNESGVRRLGASHRIGASGDDRLVVGFTISGSDRKEVLIRGLGPALARERSESSDQLPRATLSVFGSNGQLLADNDAWPASLAMVFTQAGATPLEPGSNDAAISLSLAPGTYLAVLRARGGVSGDGRLEIHAFN